MKGKKYEKKNVFGPSNGFINQGSRILKQNELSLS